MTHLRRISCALLTILTLLIAPTQSVAQGSFPRLQPPFAAPPEDKFFPQPPNDASATPIDQRIIRKLWVADTGNDTTNDGTSLQNAWRTITHAVRQMRAGDMLQVVQSAASDPYRANVDIVTSGTPQNPIVIRGVDPNGNLASPANRPLIRPVPGKKPLFRVASQYWIFEGLSIDCDGRADLYGISIFEGNHVAVHQTTIQHCPISAIEVNKSSNVLIERNILKNNTHPTLAQDANGVAIYRSSDRVRIRANIASDNTGDGVQCEGQQGVATNIIVEGNTFYNNYENAVDIKNCNNVDIIGKNIFYGYQQLEQVNPPRCGGVAVIIHNSAENLPAKNVLIDSANIYQSGIGVSLGRSDLNYQAVENIVIRRNVIHDITEEKRNCGDGVQLQNVRLVEIYHNTFDKIAHSGVMVKLGAPTSVSENVGVWNNVFSSIEGMPHPDPSHNIREGGILEFDVDRMPNFFSDFNHFFHSASPRFRNRSTNQTLSFNGGVEWKAGVKTDTQSTTGTPLFRSTSGTDAYMLAAGSPALNTARVDAGNASSNQRCAQQPDKGAIESDCGKPGSMDLQCFTPIPPFLDTPEHRYFPETRHSLNFGFKTFWENNGDLPVFGYPLSEECGELNADLQQVFTTQYFERQRFEYHPNNPDPYKVLLGRLGDEVLQARGRNWRNEGGSTNPFPNTSCDTFTVDTQTRIVCGPFRQYWRTHGLTLPNQPGVTYNESLGLFGLPLTAPKMETNPDGNTVLTQWFERTRLEVHANGQVLQGRLASEVLKLRNVPVP